MKAYANGDWPAADPAMETDDAPDDALETVVSDEEPTASGANRAAAAADPSAPKPADPPGAARHADDEAQPRAREGSAPRAREPRPARADEPRTTASSDGATAPSPNLAEGHRARLRARFDRGERLADYELLELLLFRSLPRRDTKPIAKALIKAFGSFAGAVGAPAHRLKEIDGVGPAAMTDFRLVRAAAERFAFDAIADRPLLDSTAAVVRYYRTQLRTAEREEFHVLFVDKKNRFIASECLGVGTVDHTPVYPRELMKRALDLSASAVVLVHNHPSGDPTPSRADVAMTQRICEAAAALSISVHDHLIVAADDWVSLRSEGLM